MLLIIDNADALAGLSQNDLDAFAQNAKAKNMEGKRLIPLRNTTQQPSLESLTNSDIREQLFKASVNRAEKNDSNDTRANIQRIASIRAQKAKLMGFANYAAWKLNDQMAQTPEAVDDFFKQMAPAAASKAKAETADLQTMIDKQGGGFKLQPWDWDFYSEQVGKEKYDLDAESTKPYFELYKVLQDGVFYAANQLYGITFKERKNIPVYQEDVKVYEVFDKAGTSLALFYGDYFKRDN